MVVMVDKDIKPEDLEKARQDYGDYVKVVVNVETEKMAIGGEWHADAEKIFLQNGSKQENLWGGGIDLSTGRIETLALINLRPEKNSSQDILDAKIRMKFIELVETIFEKWIKKID